MLNLGSFQTVYKRLERLGIPTCREEKPRANNARTDIVLPQQYSEELAEFIGILLGDGNVTHYQVCVTLGTKEINYASYVQNRMQKVFGGMPKNIQLKNGYRVVYMGSTQATKYLFKMGLVKNKVRQQVEVPDWIFQEPGFIKAFIRGFFDTDGSVYALRAGIQISLTNCSVPILDALQKMLLALDYSPSGKSCNKIYLTKKADIERFFREIAPANGKHLARYDTFKRRLRSGQTLQTVNLPA